MNFYEIVTIALRTKAERGAYAAVRFLRKAGVGREDRRKIFGEGAYPTRRISAKSMPPRTGSQ